MTKDFNGLAQGLGVLLSMGQEDWAESLVRSYKKENAEEPFWAFWEGLFYHRRSQFLEALGCWEDDRDLNSLLAKTITFCDLGLYEEACESFACFVQRSAEEKAWSYVLLGDEWLARGEPILAENEYARGLAQGQLPELWTGLIRCHLMQKNYKKAENLANEALEKWEDIHEGVFWALKGLALWGLKDAKSAQWAWLKAMKCPGEGGPYARSCISWL